MSLLKGGFPWQPNHLGSMILWADASDTRTITDSGGAVSQIDDKSGNGNHMSQGTGADQPTTNTRTQNGLNVLDCDGGDFLSTSVNIVPASGDICIFFVAQVDSVASAFEALFSHSISAGTDAGSFQFESNSATQFDGGVNFTTSATDFTLTGGPFAGPSIYEVECNFGTSDVIAYVDGVNRGSTSDYTTKLSTGATYVFRAMANRGGGLRVNGAFCEIIALEDCTAATREKIEGYLAHKWGTEGNLDAGHPYKSNPPLV